MVSIIMSFYNAAPYLAQTLDSILGQTHGQWELIAVNNFSTDHSLEIARQYESRDARIKVFQNPNQGLIQALQFAYAQSSGNLITRMDADDLMPPNKLAALRRALTSRGEGHVSTGLVHYFSDEGPIGNGYMRYANWLNELCRTQGHYEQIYKECVIPSPCWMVYRADFDRCGGFDRDVYPEDYDLCFRFYKQGLTVVPVLEVLHHWRDYSWRNSRVDPSYADQRFFELKLSYFLELDCWPGDDLILWGAGKKGKALVKMLVARGISLAWVTDNTRKVNHQIYGLGLQRPEAILEYKRPKVLVVVSGPAEQSEIEKQLTNWGLRRGESYFLFV